MAEVAFHSVEKSFGSQRIIKDFSLTIRSGEFVTLVGPSGCGKSTLLRILAGLEDPDQGDVLIDRVRVNDRPPSRRDLSMVFQSYALYPHMTVEENLSFPLRMARLNRAEISTRVREVADMLDLGELLQRKPAQLSGGQKQRVAMGRAIVKRPSVLLFDEPLSNLDAQLRTRVRAEIARLHRQLGATILYVTHDQVEAMTLADNLAVLRDGRLEQSGRPLDVYQRPKTSFVASFLGQPAMNLIDAKLVQGWNAAAQVRTGATVQIGFRPDVTELSSPVESRAAIPGCVLIGNGAIELIERLGSSTLLHVRLNHGPVVISSSSSRVAAERQLGEKLQVHVPSSALFQFDQLGAVL